MPTAIQPKLDVFLGLNNALNPCSVEYTEGAAYVSDNSRIDESGLWSEQAALTNCTSPPIHKRTPFNDSGSHVKNLAIQSQDQIIVNIATTESIDVGPNRYLYATADSDVDEVQTLTITGTPSGGTFTLSFNGQTTSAIAYNASAATIETAFEALSTVGADNGTCAGGALPGTPVTITFEEDLAATDVSLIVIDTTNLTGGTDPAGTVVETTKGARGAVKYQDKEGNNGNCSGLTVPSTLSKTEVDGTASRAESGTYYYMCTYFDNNRKRESLPSAAVSAEIDHDTKDHVILTGPYATSAKRVKFYRCLRTSAAANVYNPTNIFYLLAEITSGRKFTDYLHDDEIKYDEYGGRGTAPPEGVNYLAPFNNRMLYFVDNVLYWSSAGQPEDIALEYAVTIDSVSVKCKPLLSVGTYGESKFEITELAGQKVTGTMLAGGRLWVWTAGLTGFLEATSKLEGYRFTVVRKGIGLVNDKCLAQTPYGIFGADRQGIWLLDTTGQIRRLSDGVIDIKSGTGKSTALSQSDITDSFGVWLPNINEYWWNVGDIQIVYQANRNLFAGPYNHSIVGGCNFVSSGGAQAFLWGSGSYTSPTGHTPNANWAGGDGETAAYDDDLETAAENQIAATSWGNYLELTISATDCNKVRFYAELLVSGKIDVDVYYGGAYHDVYEGTYTHKTWVEKSISDGVKSVTKARIRFYNGDSVVDTVLFHEFDFCEVTGKDAIPVSSPATAQDLQFWFGQSSLSTIKDNVELEVIYNSITSDKTVTARAYQNNIASETGAADSGNYSHTDDNLVGRLKPPSSGRMILLKLTIPSDCAAPIIGTGYKANLVPWQSKSLR